MKLGLFAASAALVLGSQSAFAQPVIVQPAYAPGITIGGAVYGRGGIAVGGTFAAPGVVAQPQVYAGPVVVPPPVVVARPPIMVAPIVVGRPYVAPYGYYGYGRPYYGGYHHRRR